MELKDRAFLFQPTLPARGATSKTPLHRLPPASISTHAPRTGSDAAQVDFQRGILYFNPRSPHGERPGVHPAVPLTACISTHAPRTGSDTCARVMDRIPAISTHAPRTGSDDNRRFRPRSTQYFNPRSPHGERPSSCARNGRKRRFQPTLPARGATGARSAGETGEESFQPTLPARGATAR